MRIPLNKAAVGETLGTSGGGKPPAKKTPKAKQPCKACAQPDRFTRHTCGLKKLQDMLRF